MRFRLVPKSSTLHDLELLYVRLFTVLELYSDSPGGATIPTL